MIPPTYLLANSIIYRLNFLNFLTPRELTSRIVDLAVTECWDHIKNFDDDDEQRSMLILLNMIINLLCLLKTDCLAVYWYWHWHV